MPALISKKMPIIIASYMFLMIVYRFVLPYGGEPDFSVRVSDILYGDLIFYSPYSFSKYYVFLLPFIFYTMSSSGRFHSSLLFSLITSIVVIINLALYYI